MKNDVVLLEEYLQKGMDPNQCDDNGRTALYTAAEYGHAKCMKVLLKYGADVNIRNSYLATALHVACHGRKVNCVKLLLEYGADTKLLDWYHRSVYDVSLYRNCKEALENWKTYLPKWNRYTTAARYPVEFNEIAFAWLSSSKLPKDLKYLVIEYMAEIWKLK